MRMPGVSIRSALLLAFFFHGQAALAADSASATVLVNTQTLQMKSMSETIETYGQVIPDPDSQSNIAVLHAGTVEKLMVRPGEQVHAGQELVRLATAPASRMAYQQAKAAVKYAEAELERKRSLFSQHLVTKGDVATAEQALNSARTTLQTQEKLGSDQSVSTLRAPFDGVITSVSVAQGDQVQQNTTVVQVARRQGMLVPLGVEQEDIIRLQVGQQVIIEPVFNHNINITSAVSQIHAMANPTTGLVDVIVPVPADSTSSLIFNEMVRGHITLKEVKTLAVPRSAILTDNKGAYVFTVDGGQVAHKVYIDTSIESGGFVAISGPVKAGDRVVTTGNYELVDGMHVQEAGQ